MESAKAKAADSLEIAKFPMISPAAIGAPINCGPSAVLGEAQRLDIRFAQMPNGRKLATFEQASAIIRSIMKRKNARA
jgi:hypothetical protein